jgi:hypothetical protein
MRLENWESKLSKYLDEIRYKPFSWGEHDCALMAANAVLAMTGKDYAEKFRGLYHDAAGALRLIPEGIAQHLANCGFREIEPKNAKRGDLVLVINAKREVLGVIDLSGKHVAAPGAFSLALLPRSDAIRAWEVG